MTARKEFDKSRRHRQETAPANSKCETIRTVISALRCTPTSDYHLFKFRMFNQQKKIKKRFVMGCAQWYGLQPCLLENKFPHPCPQPILHYVQTKLNKMANFVLQKTLRSTKSHSADHWGTSYNFH